MVLQTNTEGYEIVNALDLGPSYGGPNIRKYELAKDIVNGGQCDAKGTQVSCDTCASLATQICVQIRNITETEHVEDDIS